jgi:hypothetical protein
MHRRCNAPGVRAQLPALPLALRRQRWPGQESEARQAPAEQSVRQSSHPALHLASKSQVARRASAEGAPAWRPDLPQCPPWETSEPEVDRAPAVRCQAQSPAQCRKLPSASLHPRRYSTTSATDGPTRLALVPPANLARRTFEQCSRAQLFVRRAARPPPRQPHGPQP